MHNTYAAHQTKDQRRTTQVYPHALECEWNAGEFTLYTPYGPDKVANSAARAVGNRNAIFIFDRVGICTPHGRQEDYWLVATPMSRHATCHGGGRGGGRGREETARHIESPHAETA
jgi:hypothetical protein